MRTLSKNILDILESNEFYAEHVEEQGGEFFVELSQSTPAGEDWWQTIWFDGTDEGFIEAINTRANNFDIDEEAETFIPIRGRYGVPDDIQVLLDDAKWKKAALEALAEELNDKGAE